MDHSPPTFQYQTVELSKAGTIGVGLYGAVCSARCNNLPCAAKILHPSIFQSNGLEALARFEQECQHLCTLKHHNIVQYLAISRDPETGLPVLLMELMDESLTSFLERSQQPLLYHTQINLCYDITLALAYLHSNRIIHRDLSSNNVLLVVGSSLQAKVADFGMSKLIDSNPHMTPPAKHPGTLVYMAPEALREPLVYSEKQDCFSEGVLIIQIATRQFPNPAPAVRMIKDPRFHHKRIPVVVPETERRKSHIDLIKLTHPLLPLALRCLEHNEEDRPSAKNLGDCLAVLKDSPKYTQSVQQSQEGGAQAGTEDRERPNRKVKPQLVAEIHQKQRQRKDVTTAERECQDEQLFQEKDEATGEAKKKTTLKWKRLEIEYGVDYIQPAVDGKAVYLMGDAGILEYDSEMDKMSQLPPYSYRYSALAIVNGLLTAIGGEDGGTKTNKLLSLRRRKWVKQFPPMPTKRYAATALCTGRHLLVIGGLTESDSPTNKVEVMSTDTLLWVVATSLPQSIYQATATLCGDDVYLLGGYNLPGKTSSPQEGSKPVFRCSLNALLQSNGFHRVWKRVADLPVAYSACITLKGRLLAVGGTDSIWRMTSAVYEYDPATNSWKVVSNTPAPCFSCAVAILHGSMLLVVDHKTVQIGTLK